MSRDPRRPVSPKQSEPESRRKVDVLSDDPRPTSVGASGSRKLDIPGGHQRSNSREIPKPGIPGHSSNTSPPSYEPHSSYSGKGVIPISTEIYSNDLPSAPGFAYVGKPRARAGSDAMPPPIRTRAIVHDTGLARPSSPLTRNYDAVYIQPATTKHEHKKMYSIDNSSVKLIAETEVASRESSRKERGGYHLTGLGGTFSRSRDINDTSFSYTDPVRMYRDTEPRWRSRRGSDDTGIRPQKAFSPNPSASPHPLGTRKTILPPVVYIFDDVAPLSKRSEHLEPSIQTPSQDEKVMHNYESYGKDPDYESAPEPSGHVADTLDQGERRATIVESRKDDLPLPPGIPVLRRPTKVFPEHPNPIREGVAPLKERLERKGVKEIPKNARWTKIDRKLVNPQALEEVGERFEERLDCVIILRVLTRDEIGFFARRTEEIRGVILSK
jgi:hypothetical protein